MVNVCNDRNTCTWGRLTASTDLVLKPTQTYKHLQACANKIVLCLNIPIVFLPRCEGHLTQEAIFRSVRWLFAVV